MDTSEQVAIESTSHTKRRRRRHAVNANLVFYWRKKYREGRLGRVGPAMSYR
jgi:transposase-like protein